MHWDGNFEVDELLTGFCRLPTGPAPRLLAAGRFTKRGLEEPRSRRPGRVEARLRPPPASKAAATGLPRSKDPGSGAAADRAARARESPHPTG